MDIRSIIDADDAPPPRKRSGPGSISQDFGLRPAEYTNPREAQTQIYHERRDGRPPQPSPLQTPGHTEHWANGRSQNAIQSPYQQTPPSSLNSAHHLPPHIPSHSPVHGPQFSQRESYPTSSAPVSRSYGPPTPLSQTSTTSTPGSAQGYPNHGRPSSSHSITTPNSAQQPSSYFRGSPQASHSQTRTLSQSQTGPHYMSQPSTPLGPPSTLPRSNFSLRRESPGSYNHEQALPGGMYGHPQAASPSPATAGSPKGYGVRYSQSMSHEPISLRERERSLSVSPKTRLPSIPSMNSSEVLSSEIGTRTQQDTLAKRKVETNLPHSASVHEPTLSRTQSTKSRMSSIGVNGLLNAAPTREPPGGLNRHSQPETPSTLDTESNNTSFNYIPRNHTSSAPYHSNIPSVSQLPSNAKMLSSVKIEDTASNNSPSKATKKRAHDQIPADNEIKRPIELEEIASPTDKTPVPSLPANKKPRLGDSPNNPMPISVDSINTNRSTSAPGLKQEPKTNPEMKQKPSRWKEIPIWAQSVPRPNRTPNGNPRRPAPRQAPSVPASASTQPNGQPNGVQGSNGHINQANGVHIPVAQPALASTGPLGPWEPSFLNIIPAEEMVRIVSDWLFQNVVQRLDVGVGPAGGGTDGGAVLEIEAKIGQLIDKNTNDRLRLPVLNECVVSHTDPSMRIAFKSSMTEVQHKSLNQFLNEAVRQANIRAPASSNRKPRIPMDYKHTRETDTFYELTQAGALALPQSIASGLNINPRHANKSKVRITTDQKTGNVLAKIIKARVADIDIYSPRTLFDWRISINVEMDYKGEMTDLVEPQTRDGKLADRNKDRMSYKHLAYQIDLTQVAPAEPTSKTDKEHELEIEVSSEEVRRQGQLLMSGQPNQYEDLIRGFVDNVRILARHCQS